MSHKPSPYGPLKGKLSNTGKTVLISAKYLQELLSALESDRILGLDNIGDSPSPKGRTLLGNVGGTGGNYNHPFRVTTFKDDLDNWNVRIETNGGTFCNANFEPMALNEDDNGNIEQTFDCGDGILFAVSFTWTYNFDGVKKLAIDVDTFGSVEALDPIITPFENNGEGKSRIVLAIGKGAGKGEDHKLVITRQLVVTSLLASWIAAYYDDEDEKMKAAMRAIPYNSMP